ncbi:MAG: FprA family A-type flavoprotein, partial [Candidatus Omnitrophica bacterium]|nr:FprA family A-type flavoprotein [Candidatus Omnitrophota bacterium]
CKGLAPKNRIGIAFGSYGWGGQAVGAIEKIFDEMKLTVPVRGLKIQYVPFDAELNEFIGKVRPAV